MFWSILVGILVFQQGVVGIGRDVEAPTSHEGHKHHYQFRDEVELFVNTVTPFRNPSETYPFYSLPFCKPGKMQHNHQTLGEVLEGDRLTESLYDLRFRVDIPFRSLCEVHMQPKETDAMIHAIENQYFAELVYDGLPVWNLVGMTTEENGRTRTLLFTHLHFVLGYNEDNIVSINITTDTAQTRELIEGQTTKVEYSYSAKWSERTDLTFETRYNVYTEGYTGMEEMEVHWMSIMNAVVLSILLMSFMSIVVARLLKKDFNRYDKDEEESDGGEEYGWKLISGDVFRNPPYPSILAAGVGTGMQFLAMMMFIVAFSLIGMYYPYNRGSVVASVVVLYALTSLVGGYTSALWYVRLGGKTWAWNTILAAGLFGVPFFLVWAVLNSVAWGYGSTQALPAGTVVIVLALWVFVGLPLTVVGGIAGRNASKPTTPPCRTTKAPREIPPLPILAKPWLQVLMAGGLEFSAIYVELYFIFNAVWAHQMYIVWHVLAIAFVLLMLVTACITVIVVYFQLVAEDHRWWWRSVLASGSVSFFYMLYSLYYFSNSSMTGFMQTSFFFGYNFLIAYAIFLMLGTVGFLSANIFVTYIYSNLKIE